MKLSKVKVIHVSAWAEALWHFRMPLLRRQKEIFNEVVVYCSDQQYCRDASESFQRDGHVRHLMDEGFRVQIGRISSTPQFDIFYQIWTLYRFLKKEKFDIIMTHQPMGSLVGITAAYMANVPIRIYNTGGLKFVPDRKNILNLVYKFVELILIKMSGAVFIVNREDEEYLKAIPYAKDKVYYVGPSGGCGIDTKKYNSQTKMKFRKKVREELGFSDEVFVIGFVGRCVWEKGFKEMIDAAHIIISQYPDRKIIFLIAGVGKELDQIKSYAQKKGVLQYFNFLGYKFNADYYMAGFDTFILPSYREGMPISLLEAMSMGIPCIAANIRGSRELISTGENGLLVALRDAEGLANAILYLMAQPQHASIFGQKAEASVKTKYDADLLLHETFNILSNIINSSSKKRDYAKA